MSEHKKQIIGTDFILFSVSQIPLPIMYVCLWCPTYIVLLPQVFLSTLLAESGLLSRLRERIYGPSVISPFATFSFFSLNNLIL